MKVVPVFAEIFKDFGKPLPAPTQFLVDLSDLMRNDWYYFIGGVVAVFFGIKYFLRTQRGHELWNKMAAQAAGLRPRVHKIAMSRFARTFAQLIRSGVPILETLEIVGGSAGYTVIEHSIRASARMWKRATTSPSAVQEDDLPADDAAHGLGRRIHRQDRRDARKDGRLLGTRRSRRRSTRSRACSNRSSSWCSASSSAASSSRSSCRSSNSSEVVSG